MIQNCASLELENTDKYTALHIAAQEGNYKIVNYLIEKGAEINKTCLKDTAPLHIACERGHIEVVKSLLGNGAMINVKNEENCTPLYVASREGHLNVVEFLLLFETSLSSDVDKTT